MTGVVVTGAAKTSAPAKRVLVVGDVMSDIVVQLGGDIAWGSDTPALIEETQGGAGANAATWLAHYGANVTLAARVGSDDHAAQCEQLRACGVTPALVADQDRQTGRLIALVDRHGERSFLTDRGAGENLCAADLPETLFEGISLLHVSGYALFAPASRAAVRALMATARQRKIPVSVDPGSASGLVAAGPQNFLDWITGADFCFPNAQEAAVLTGTPDRDRQVAYLLQHCNTLVIKAGSLGAHLYADGGMRTIGCAFPGPQVVDTTGAGDAFLGAFLAIWLAGKPLEACLVGAVRAGGQACGRVGGRPPPGKAPLPLALRAAAR